jgi:iron(II)-dependent oxidoreductase
VDKYENAVSPYGVYQQIGNVAEWVADWYDSEYYKNSPDRNPKGPDQGKHKAFRGASWIDSTTTARAAQRNGADPNTKMNWLGFRCARDAQEPQGRQVSLADPPQDHPAKGLP